MSDSTTAPRPEPFKISVPDEQLQWINDRVRTTRLPPSKESSTPDDLWAYGLPLATAEKLHRHWTEKYDWRAVEAAINDELTQFTMPVEYNGETLTIHFVHHRSPNPSAIPLLFLHGWPGSFLEVRPIISRLTHPPPESDEPSYHVVAPSLVGFSFSSFPRKPFGPLDHAAVVRALMHQLGYPTFVAQGGDWGSMIARILGIHHPAACPAVHINFVAAAPPSPLWYPLRFSFVMLNLVVGGVWGTQTPYEKALLHRLLWWRRDEFGYAAIQGTKPQTLQYALADSPFGFVCWVRDKIQNLVDYDAGWEWKDEDVITMVMPYIINGTAGHAEPYRAFHDDGKKGIRAYLFDRIIPRTSSFGASIFPKEVAYCQRWWAETKVAENIVFWKEHDKGGHFAALERPEVLVADIRAFTQSIDKQTLDKLREAGARSET